MRSCERPLSSHNATFVGSRRRYPPPRLSFPLSREVERSRLYPSCTRSSPPLPVGPGGLGGQSVFPKAAIRSARAFPFLHLRREIPRQSNREQILGKRMLRTPVDAIGRATFPLWVRLWERARAASAAIAAIRRAGGFIPPRSTEGQKSALAWATLLASIPSINP